MRFTEVQGIINDERGLAIWNSRWKYSAYYLRFQCVFNANSTSTKTWAVGYCKVLETKGIYILNNLVFSLFENL